MALDVCAAFDQEFYATHAVAHQAKRQPALNHQRLVSVSEATFQSLDNLEADPTTVWIYDDIVGTGSGAVGHKVPCDGQHDHIGMRDKFLRVRRRSMARRVQPKRAA